MKSVRYHLFYLLFCCFVLSLFISFPVKSQECSYTIKIILKNINGGVFAGQKVILSDKSDGTLYEQISDQSGTAELSVPCNSSFELSVSNYTRSRQIQSYSGGAVTQTLSYEADMAEKDKLFEMTEQEKINVDKTADQLEDSLIISGSRMTTPKNSEHFVMITLRITDLNKKPLADERVTFKGLKRNRKIIGTTDFTGRLILFVPKGDNYILGFKYNSEYSSYEYKYSKGSSKVEINLSYLGTKEIERRKKEEALRIAELEKREKETRERFENDCKKMKLSLEECYKREWERLRTSNNTDDTVVSAVLNRNKWFDKLIICDLTGSMQPYYVQLSVWYQLHYKKEKNLQFIFFNDGDGKQDSEKKIGETGGIYYSPSKGIDSLGLLMSRICAKGDGGDCPENNMEAMIKGTKMAKQFKEIIAIVDNNSPVKDIKLLKEFTQPVHIILCGSSQGWILPDYLLIAWKTKGTIHTIEEDITSLARMSEGMEIKIGQYIYKIMGGEFVQIKKI